MLSGALPRPRRRPRHALMWAFAALATAVALVMPSRSLAATTISNTTSRGQVAFARFDRVDGCIETFAQVQAANGKITDLSNGRTTSSSAFVLAAIFDRCTSTQLKFYFGVADLAPGEFSATARTATLNAVVPAFEFVSQTTVPLTVAMTWTGVGQPARVSEIVHSTSAGTTSVFRATANAVFASAAGTVSDGVVNLAPDPALPDAAQIQSNSNASLLITR
jgi:hypothetical protein